jgi:hypothetical protein
MDTFRITVITGILFDVRSARSAGAAADDALGINRK